jgi:uncharacterized protein (TIGR00251 family)
MKLVAIDGGVRFEVWAKPRSKKSRIVGERGDAIEISLGAPPVDGAANEELVRVLADVLGVPKRAVVIVRGDTSQRKVVEVFGVSVEEARSLLLP